MYLRVSLIRIEFSIISIANTSNRRFSRELVVHRGNMLKIIIDIFLSDWRRQVRPVRTRRVPISIVRVCSYKRTLEEMVTRGERARGEGPSALEPTLGANVTSKSACKFAE